MPYILDLDGDYIKQCETDGCPNVILIGVSRTHCIRCLEKMDDDLEVKIIPYYKQKVMM